MRTLFSYHLFSYCMWSIIRMLFFIAHRVTNSLTLQREILKRARTEECGINNLF